MGVEMKRIALMLAVLMALGSGLTLAQRSVRVQGRNAPGGKRVALVIGNAKYGRSMGRLVNPANDAARFEMLKRFPLPAGILDSEQTLAALVRERQQLPEASNESRLLESQIESLVRSGYAE